MSSGSLSCGAAVGRYLSGLCVSALALCAGGWLVLTPFAFGYRSRGRAAVTDFATGGGLVLVASLTLVCWALAWRRRLRADGVLPPRPSRRSRRSARRQARAERLVRATRTPELVAAPDPAQVLTDLRALLTPLLAAEDSALVRTVPSLNGTSHSAFAGQQVPPAEWIAETSPADRQAPPANRLAEAAAADYPLPSSYGVPQARSGRCDDAAGSAEAVTDRAVTDRPVTDRPATDRVVTDRVVAVAEVPVTVPAPAVTTAEARGENHQVQAPGHLRGTRSASFLAPAPPPAETLLRGAELLMVGTGEEEAW
jgi:African swine fever virus J13L protein